MNSIDIIKRYSIKPIEVELSNEDGDKDKITLNPLNNAQRILLFKVLNSMNESRDGLSVDELADKEKYATENFLVLCKETLGLENNHEDSDMIENFILCNFNELLMGLIKVYPSPKSKTINKIKELQEKVKNKEDNVDVKQC